MVVESFNAYITNRAMLGSSRLFKFTCYAFILFLKHYFIELIFPFGELCAFLVGDDTWVNRTGFIEAIIARYHEDRACYPVVASEVGARTIFEECLLNVDVVAAHCQRQVEYLNCRIRLIREAIDEPVQQIGHWARPNHPQNMHRESHWVAH